MTPFAVSLDLKKEISLLGFDEKLTEECQLLVGGKISQIEIRMFRDKNPSMERPDENLIKFWQNWCEIHSQDTNEPMVSVGKIEREGKKIILYAHQKTYAEYLYNHQKPKLNKLLTTSPHLDNGDVLPLSVGAVALTAPSPQYPQGCVIFAKRGQTSFYASQYTLVPGGYLHPEIDRISFKRGDSSKIKRYFRLISFEKGLNREFKEELPGLRPYYDLKILGIFYNRSGSRQPMIAVSLRLEETAEEAQETLRQYRPDWEIEHFVFVPADTNSLREFLKNNRDKVVPDAVYRLVLWLNNI